VANSSAVGTPGPAASRVGGRRPGFRATVGTVTEIEPIAARMRRIRIEGAQLSRLAWTPGQHLRVHVTDMSDPRNWLRPRDLLRTYSVWQRDDDGIELCALDHDETAGPGARWARSLAVGDAVTFGGPEGHFVLGDGAYHLFAGEETAAVAFGAMLRALPPTATACGVIEVDQPGDRLPLARELDWQYRHGRSAAASGTLLTAVSQLPLPARPGVAYLAGEASTIQLLRRHLVSDRGWPRQAIRMKPFWAPGKRGLD
jgi:NADPH-dependent ferric siderophore reductase